MAKKQFKTESKRLLELMINSIYTHKEIFLRELLSNASDALDKLYFRSLTDDSVKLAREDFHIRITPDAKNRTLTISDNGCGMSAEELENNLGIIAQSGTLAFRKENTENKEVDVIGQFGVGFYSSFMVASNVRVVSRAFAGEQAYQWESSGTEGYTITPCERAEAGTDVILTLKEDTEEEKYGVYLQEYMLSSLVKKYSDYIRYPIRMEVEKSRLKEGSESDYEQYKEEDVLNSMVPLWKKSKAEITDEEYAQFYMDKFHDFEAPLLRIHTSVEGAVSYTALLFIPNRPPYDFYSKEYKRGLQLYTSGVMIMDKCEDLLPDYFGFVRGLVDSADLSLNISREMLQHDRQLQVIAKNLKKKIKAELFSLLENDREKYVTFFKAFGLTLKYGLYAGYGANKDFLQDLVLFHSAKENKLITLKEYVDAMPAEQKDIYYACAETTERAINLPQTELVRDKGFDILCLTDDVDEFALKMLHAFQEKPFRSVSDKELDLSTEEEKKVFADKEKEHADLLFALQKALDGQVKAVRLSSKLKNSPVCLVSDGPLSIEMEKVLSAMPMSEAGGPVKADRVLEINPEHSVFTALASLPEGDPKLEEYAKLLYDQALLIEGLPIEDPVAFSNRVCALMK
ncbi:MAG: molecular chaperone HtpG [Candidatus Pelethousia sp.]|nr:molecular chaperone HtpG [Candidatus Pelethousia sp.]